MTTLLIKNMLRSKGLVTGLVILMLSGIISLQIGKSFLRKNESVIALSSKFQKESIKRNVDFHPEDIGLLLYYVKFGFVNKMSNLTGLAIGQRDINLSVHSITIRNLEEQKYNTDILNPLYQMLGNMDFSFVLIYLFPLVIIAFCFNLISEEKEEGTWSLILSQSLKPLKLISIKLALRYLAVLILLFLLFIIAKIYLVIPLNKGFIAFVVISVLYITFWFAISWLVVSLHKNSGQNAMILLISWLMLTVVLPAGINAINEYLYPVPEAFSTVLESRDGYHNKWDEAKEPTVARFHELYPQFSQFKHPKEKDYSWIWYYAMQQMGDDEASSFSKAFKEKLKIRNQLSLISGFFIPTVQTQLSLNSFAQSDMDNQLRFMVKLEKFHEMQRLYFYPKIFNEAKVMEENWDKFSLKFHNQSQSINWLQSIIPLLVIITMCFGWAAINFSYKKFF